MAGLFAEMEEDDVNDKKAEEGPTRQREVIIIGKRSCTASNEL